MLSVTPLTWPTNGQRCIMMDSKCVHHDGQQIMIRMTFRTSYRNYRSDRCSFSAWGENVCKKYGWCFFNDVLYYVLFNFSCISLQLHGIKFSILCRKCFKKKYSVCMYIFLVLNYLHKLYIYIKKCRRMYDYTLASMIQRIFQNESFPYY